MHKQYYTLLILLCTTSTFIFSMEINRDTDNRSEVSELSGDETKVYDDTLVHTQQCEISSLKKQLIKSKNQSHLREDRMEDDLNRVNRIQNELNRAQDKIEGIKNAYSDLCDTKEEIVVWSMLAKCCLLGVFIQHMTSSDKDL